MKIRLFFAALVLLALGSLINWGLGPWNDEPSKKKDESAETRGDQGRSAPPATSLERRRPALVPYRTSEREPDPIGSLRLEGQVIDSDELPVEGATVFISTVPPRQVRVEADGSFAFDKLAARAYQLEAVKDGLHAGPVEVVLTDATEPVILRTRERAPLLVEVLEATSSEPVEGALVELRGHTGLRQRAHTDANGKATLHQLGRGDVQLHVRAEGYGRQAKRLPDYDSKGLSMSVRLRAGITLAGQVVDPSGKALPGVQVQAEPSSEPFPLFRWRDDRVDADGKGRFIFEGLEPGSYRISVRSEGWTSSDLSPLLLESDVSDLRVVAQPAGQLEGRVVDESGAAVAGATLTLTATGSIPWRQQQVASSDAEGRFHFAGLEPMSAELIAKSSSHSSELSAVEIRAGETSSAELILSQGGRISGTVVDASGEPLPEASVHLQPVWTGAVGERQAWAARGQAHGVSDAGGLFSFTGLPDGEYELRAAPNGSSGVTLLLAEASRARTGDTELELVVEGERTLSGRLTLPTGEAPRLFRVAVDGARPDIISHPEGRFALSLPPGPHSVVFSGPQFRHHRMEVMLVAGKDKDLGSIEVEAGRSISGRVLDPNGVPLADAEVAAGALLTGDGQQLFIPDESIRAQATKTDQEGNYLIDGLEDHPLTLIAGSEGTRSRALHIPAGRESLVVDLHLESTGSLAGRIEKDAAPLGDTVVIAMPIGTSSNSFVVTGADGSYSFDRLPPGRYALYPMIGGGGPRPKDMYISTVEVQAAQKATRDVSISSGSESIEIVAVDEGGEVAPMAMLLLVWEGQKQGAPRSAKEFFEASWLRNYSSEAPPVPVYLRNQMGTPQKVDGLAAGSYTLCAARGERRKGPPRGALQCKPVQVGKGAKSVSIELPAPSED